eukprot:tig00000981_g5875.t1
MRKGSLVQVRPAVRVDPSPANEAAEPGSTSGPSDPPEAAPAAPWAAAAAGRGRGAVEAHDLEEEAEALLSAPSSAAALLGAPSAASSAVASRRGSAAEARLVTVLSLDAGGYRGVISMAVLAELEALAGRRVADLFDVFAGTSAGAIGLGALLLPPELATGHHRGKGWSAADALQYMRDGYREITGMWTSLGARVVEGLARAVLPCWAPTLDHGRVHATFDALTGDFHLSDVRGALVVPACDLEADAPFVFRSRAAREEAADDYRHGDGADGAPARRPGARAAPRAHGPNAAPPPATSSGLWAANPALLAYNEARRLYPTAKILVVSIGTGEARRPRPERRRALRNRSAIGWLFPIISYLWRSQESVPSMLLEAMSAGAEGGAERPENVEFLRFQVELSPREMHYRNISPAAFDRFVAAARQQVCEAQRETLRQLASRLASTARMRSAAAAAGGDSENGPVQVVPC